MGPFTATQQLDINRERALKDMRDYSDSKELLDSVRSLWVRDPTWISHAINPATVDSRICLSASRRFRSSNAFDQMNADQRKRRDMTLKFRASTGFTRLALLACVSFAVTVALGSGSGKAVGPQAAEKPGPVGQAGKKADDQPNAPSAKHVTNDYIIGPSDILAINVWKDAELTRTVPVRPDGKISLPLIGELQVSGLTAQNVQRMVAERLKEYVSDPEVTVIVQEVKSRTYVIVGKVTHPGSYELGKPTTVLEAIAIAGGFLDFAKPNKAYVIRRASDGSTERLPFDYKKVIDGHTPEQNVDLMSGDTIVVP
jgi:polysaccharide export outer membrane protein